MVVKCPASNTASVEQEAFWDGNWTPHKIGWVIAGSAAAVTCLLALITIIGHARNYNKPLEQRQIIRVLLFPPVYAVVSFLSYRFFRAYTYYELAEAAYESFAIAAFLMLMLQFIGTNVNEQKSVFARKDKKPLPLPFCCWRYRPSKAYFLVLLKWSVVQYCFVRPALSIAGIVTEYYEVYCSSSLSYRYAYVYLTSVDFVSITVALYGLIVLYTLVKEDLQGKRPLAKFATIKIGIFLIFYQGFIFSLLANHGVLHATQYWSTTNIADGLNALCTSLEMVLIAAMQMWAFNWREYHIQRVDRPSGKANGKGKTNIFMSILHALNFTDLLIEFWYELVFLFDRIRGKEYTRRDARLDFVQAFGAEHDDDSDLGKPTSVSQMELSEAPHGHGALSVGDRGRGQQTSADMYAGGYGGHDRDGYSESTRSNHGLLRPLAPAGAQDGQRQTQPYIHGQDSAGQYGFSQHDQYASQPSDPASAGFGQGVERPRSWEPQAY